jgi:hypothetical protein
MEIVAIRDEVVPIKSSIRNAFIDFSQMTASIVRIETDVIRDGKSVVGYGFNSNGRYAQSGILRDRIIPRLLKAAPEDLLDDEGTNSKRNRSFRCSPIAITRAGPIPISLSMPPEATTIRAKTYRPSKMKCRATSTSAITR